MMKHSIFFIFFNILISNSVSKHIDKILHQGKDYNKEEIKIIRQKFKNNHDLLVLNGLSEIDGEISNGYFIEYMKKNPSGDFSELSIFKIAEYYYSKAEYINSANWYKKIPDNFPASNKLETAISYYLNALVISDQSDSARYYANKMKKEYPKINSLNSNFLTADKNATLKKNKFSVKVGSYDKLSTALYYKNILQKEKFSVILKENKIGGSIIYSLLIGEYKNKNNAISVKNRLLSRLGISDCEIIKLN